MAHEDGHDHDHDRPHAPHGHHEHGHHERGHHEHAHHEPHGQAHASHGHEHHGHGHAHATHAPARAPLEAGAGSGGVLLLDAFSGLAGDMIIASLLDLGVPLAVVERAVSALPLSGFHVHVGHAHRSGIVATTFDVHVEARQPERTYGAIDAMLASAALDDRVKRLARAIFLRLGEAEATVHRMPLADVHFHEVGAVDAIVDVVGAAACLAWLDAELVVTPLPMSHGFVRARHGILPVPPPAVVECLRGVPTYATDVAAELVTPTGAAIVAAAASRFARWPEMAPSRSGWGAGQRELPDRPNVLRAVLGRPAEASAPTDASHVVLEANVDDMTGELAAHAIERLLAAGALDAWAAPITMKKGRPAFTIAALATAAGARAVVAAMLTETTSLGVRETRVSRTERPRRMIDVETRFGRVAVKVAEGDLGPPQIKPEFDACRALAAAAGVPVREVVAAALVAARARLDG